MGRVSMERQVGPVGTASRIVVSAAAIVLAGSRGDMTWWDAAAAIVGFPVVAFIVLRASRKWRASGARAWPGQIRYVESLAVLLIAVGLTFVTPADEPAVWLWVGVSLLLAAARGDAGCEVAAVPNLLVGRRESVGCIVFTPIDAAEARHRSRRAARAAAGR